MMLMYLGEDSQSAIDANRTSDEPTMYTCYTYIYTNLIRNQKYDNKTPICIFKKAIHKTLHHAYETMKNIGQCNPHTSNSAFSTFPIICTKCIFLHYA